MRYHTFYDTPGVYKHGMWLGWVGMGGDGWAWVGMGWDGGLGSVGWVRMGDQMGAGRDSCGQQIVLITFQLHLF